MPYVQSFSVSQTALAPSQVILTDTSTGSDGAISQRRIYIQDAQGNYIVPSGVTTDYIEWSIGLTSITLDVLTTDVAAFIRVDWLNVSNAVLYTLTQEYALVQYNKQFFYTLIQDQGLKPEVVQDKDYNANMALFWANIHGAEQAVELAGDVAASQNCINRLNNMRLNQTLYF